MVNRARVVWSRHEAQRAAPAPAKKDYYASFYLFELPTSFPRSS
jgi:hypothetical protein